MGHDENDQTGRGPVDLDSTFNKWQDNWPRNVCRTTEDAQTTCYKRCPVQMERYVAIWMAIQQDRLCFWNNSYSHSSGLPYCTHLKALQLCFHGTRTGAPWMEWEGEEKNQSVHAGIKPARANWEEENNRLTRLIKLSLVFFCCSNLFFAPYNKFNPCVTYR